MHAVLRMFSFIIIYNHPIFTVLQKYLEDKFRVGLVVNKAYDALSYFQALVAGNFLIVNVIRMIVASYMLLMWLDLFIIGLMDLYNDFNL